MGKEKEVDVCIIGSGAGGAPVAYALGKAGFSVVVLEAGPHYSPQDYHLNKTAIIDDKEIFDIMGLTEGV